jgi:hypothetical protein
MMAIWNGTYKRTDGSEVAGPSIRELAAEKSADAAARVDEAMQATLADMQVMKDKADSGEMAYDQMLGAGNEAGNKLVDDVVNGLVEQARAVEAVVAAQPRHRGRRFRQPRRSRCRHRPVGGGNAWRARHAASAPLRSRCLRRRRNCRALAGQCRRRASRRARGRRGVLRGARGHA